STRERSPTASPPAATQRPRSPPTRRRGRDPPPGWCAPIASSRPTISSAAWRSWWVTRRSTTSTATSRAPSCRASPISTSASPLSLGRTGRSRERAAMITRFSTLYVGHIELERCGLAGTPADARRCRTERRWETSATAAALAQAADALGYETLWLAEHHFQHEGFECIPSIPMLAVDLAHRTRRVKIGCAFNVVPTWHPLRLAEDYAVADILTGGRLIFGVGRGYHTREVETFGRPMLDAEANRELFEEQVEIILKAFR